MSKKILIRTELIFLSFYFLAQDLTSPKFQISDSSGNSLRGVWGACPQLGHRERSSRYPG